MGNDYKKHIFWFRNPQPTLQSVLPQGGFSFFLILELGVVRIYLRAAASGQFHKDQYPLMNTKDDHTSGHYCCTRMPVTLSSLVFSFE